MYTCHCNLIIIIKHTYYLQSTNGRENENYTPLTHNSIYFVRQRKIMKNTKPNEIKSYLFIICTQSYLKR